MGGQLPFDRHDWWVDRCGHEVRYVIDFYFHEEAAGTPQVRAFYIGVFLAWNGCASHTGAPQCRHSRCGCGLHWTVWRACWTAPRCPSTRPLRASGCPAPSLVLPAMSAGRHCRSTHQADTEPACCNCWQGLLYTAARTLPTNGQAGSSLVNDSSKGTRQERYRTRPSKARCQAFCSSSRC